MRLLLLRIFVVVIAALVASIIVALWRTGAVRPASLARRPSERETRHE
jgi:hypothetical protein